MKTTNIIKKIELITYHENCQGVNNSYFYHILLPSKKPILMSLALFASALSFVITNSIIFSNLNIIIASFIMVLYFWAFDMLYEGREHTNLVRRGIKIGMTLFIISEVMFFFAFFRTYFSSSIKPFIQTTEHAWPSVNQVKFLINSIWRYHSSKIKTIYGSYDYFLLNNNKKYQNYFMKNKFKFNLSRNELLIFLNLLFINLSKILISRWIYSTHLIISLIISHRFDLNFSNIKI